MSFTEFSNSVTVSDAFRKLECISKRYPPQSKTVNVSSLEPGRILAEDIEKDEEIPAVRASTVHDFAATVNQLGTKRKFVGLSTAVTPYNARLQLGECVRITNGGVVPESADTLVPFENIALNDDDLKEENIEFGNNSMEKSNIGEKRTDAKSGDVLLKEGHKLDSLSIRLLKTLEVEQVEIYKKPRVCVMSIENGHSQNKVHGNLNRFQLLALLQIHGFKAIDAGTSSNNSRKIKKALRVAANFACVVVITGVDDHARRTLQKLDLKFEIERVSSSPGDFSFAHGSVDDKPVLLCMLPQDLVSSWIGVSIFVLPLLRAMEGREIKSNIRWKAILTKSIPMPTETTFISARSEFIDGRLHSTPVNCEPLLGANSILEVFANESYSAGDLIDAIITEFI
ncbi:unnamed protein product [Caenorhabditis brenneri]